MDTNAVLSGKMKFIALGDLLQILGSNGSTGTLRLKSRYASGPGMVFFNNGHPVNATADHLTGLEALYALFGWVDAEFEFCQETFVYCQNYY